jgi:hypothetical protein
VRQDQVEEQPPALGIVGDGDGPAVVYFFPSDRIGSRERGRFHAHAVLRERRADARPVRKEKDAAGIEEHITQRHSEPPSPRFQVPGFQGSKVLRF